MIRKGDTESGGNSFIENALPHRFAPRQILEEGAVARGVRASHDW